MVSVLCKLGLTSPSTSPTSEQGLPTIETRLSRKHHVKLDGILAKVRCDGGLALYYWRPHARVQGLLLSILGC